MAAAASRQYVDVRALLLDPADLRGIPWRDSADRTRWAPPTSPAPLNKWRGPADGAREAALREVGGGGRRRDRHTGIGVDPGATQH